MADAVGAANADTANAEGQAGVAGRRTTSNVETSDLKIDVGEAEAQARGLAEHNDFMAAAAKRMVNEALDHVNNVRKVSEQMLVNMVSSAGQMNANMVDVAQKNSLRAVKMVTDVADSAIAAEIVEDTAGDA